MTNSQQYYHKCTKLEAFSPNPDCPLSALHFIILLEIIERAKSQEKEIKEI